MIRIRVMIVDDHVVVREGLAALLATEPDFVLAGSFGSGAEAVAHYQREKPDVVLLDVRMPDMDGLATLDALLHADRSARVVMLSSHAGDEVMHKALTKGAVGYVLKNMPVDDFIAAVRTARSARLMPTGQVAIQLANRAFYEPLSDREVQVLRHVADGQSTVAISTTLGISPSTTKRHINNILGKLAAADRAQAVVIAVRRGIIDLGG